MDTWGSWPITVVTMVNRPLIEKPCVGVCEGVCVCVCVCVVVSIGVLSAASVVGFCLLVFAVIVCRHNRYTCQRCVCIYRREIVRRCVSD